MKELGNIINKRDIQFKESTIEIFLEMDLSIECIETFLSSVDPMFNAGNFAWNDVFLENELITILGVVSFDAGTKIETDTGLVDITEDNEEYFQRVVRMALPYELVAEKNKDHILKFLKKLHAAGAGENFGDVIDGAPKLAPKTDFDLSDLTSAQQSALKMYDQNKKHKA